MTIIRFGKYRNLDIKDVYNKDPNYTAWLFSQKQIINRYPNIKQFLEDIYLEKDEYYIPIGKYKNKSLKWVFEHDQEYLIYLNSISLNNPGLSELQEALKKYKNG